MTAGACYQLGNSTASKQSKSFLLFRQSLEFTERKLYKSLHSLQITYLPPANTSTALASRQPQEKDCRAQKLYGALLVTEAAARKASTDKS